MTAWEESLVATDDPRWIEAERGVISTSNAQDEAAAALINIMPATFAGIMALLTYSATPIGTGRPKRQLRWQSKQ